jgi:hypothetical protein
MGRVLQATSEVFKERVCPGSAKFGFFLNYGIC